MSLLEVPTSVWNSVVQCYSPLGERPSGLPKGVSHFHCQRWRSATLSPFFIDPRIAVMKQLPAIEAHFRKHPKKWPYDLPHAYFHVLLPRRSHWLKRHEKALREAGWKPRAELQTLNAWKEHAPLATPKGFHWAVGRYFDRKIHRDFTRAMRSNFKSSPVFLRELDAMSRGIEERIRAVVIYSERGKIAGAGLAATRNGGSFLYCGSIMREFRGRGLWELLVSARQLVSAEEQGAGFWVTTTVNPRIRWKGESAYQLLTFDRVTAG